MSMKKTNEELSKEGKARRAKLWKRYCELRKEHGRGSVVLLAEEEKVSVQRMSWLLLKAKLDSHI